ncbi:hypothetical protein CDAR_570741 [Caerostris darwini]|uniref:Uncharacterized protein n=1 Tax=Caerostris darwini TaxID=1538125 RepID=A0AAV4QE65_9ARAC|nr:hypothetical protein CDAR_570741 [Caerostris darwini]
MGSNEMSSLLSWRTNFLGINIEGAKPDRLLTTSRVIYPGNEHSTRRGALPNMRRETVLLGDNKCPKKEIKDKAVNLLSNKNRKGCDCLSGNFFHWSIPERRETVLLGDNKCPKKEIKDKAVNLLSNKKRKGCDCLSGNFFHWSIPERRETVLLGDNKCPKKEIKDKAVNLLSNKTERAATIGQFLSLEYT